MADSTVFHFSGSKIEMTHGKLILYLKKLQVLIF